VLVDEFTFSAASVGRLANTLHVVIREHQLAISDDAALVDELANVRLKETAPGVVRLDHDADKHDDRAVTLALAATWLLDRPPAVPDVVVHFEDMWTDEDEAAYQLAHGELPFGPGPSGISPY
jgi:hypothetical protein